MKLFLFFFFLLSCTNYKTPPRKNWLDILKGVNFTDMTSQSIIAKKPVYIGTGGKLVNSKSVKLNYGDKNINDSNLSIWYMKKLEYELYDSLLKPGISVQRAGTDVIIILIRDAIMKMDVAEFSNSGVDSLKTISNILKKYDATFLEVSGYTDSSININGTKALSLDMAQRVAIYLVQSKINPNRIFLVGRGATNPIAAQDDIGRLTNRRIEIRITPAR